MYYLLSFCNNIYTSICEWSVLVRELGFYGKSCCNQCSLNCIVTNSCDRFTGECNGGCKTGWTGMTCVQSKYDKIKYLEQNKNFSKSVWKMFKKCELFCEYFICNLTEEVYQMIICFLQWKRIICSCICINNEK